MKIFLSWSGERSQALGRALKDWLPLVLHYADPWLSERDISVGNRWPAEVAKELENSNFGVLCLTRENLTAPWILFEAGALSKIVSSSSVCPLLLDLEVSELSGPLSQFQAARADKKGTLDLLCAINKRASQTLDPVRLPQVFDGLWSRFESQLKRIPPQSHSPKPMRAQEEILEELVATVRGLDHRFRELEMKALAPAEAAGSRFQNTKNAAPLMMYIEVQGEFRDLKNGMPISFDYSGGDLGEEFSKMTRLPLEELGVGWHLKDAESGQPLTQEEYRDPVAYFGRREPRLILDIVQLGRSPNKTIGTDY